MRLDEIKARAAAATEGPWVNDSTEIGRPFPGTDTIDVWVAESCHPNGDGIDGEANAEFIAHARTDIPALAAAVEAYFDGVNGHPKIWTDEEVYSQNVDFYEFTEHGYEYYLTEHKAFKLLERPLVERVTRSIHS